MSGEKAIFVSPVNIFDKRGNGGAKASLEHLEMLQKMIGIDNVLIILFVTEDDEINDIENHNVIAIKKPKSKLKLLLASFWGCRVYMPWEERNILKLIAQYNPSFIFFDYSIEGRLVKKCKRYKSMVFFHNIEADYTYSRMKSVGIHLLPAYLAAKKNDKWASKFADEVLCFNKRDSDRLIVRYGRRADSCIPISFSDQFDENLINYTEKKEILFIGSCFGPNQDGVEWFVKEVMPHLPDITLHIVGKGFEDIREKLEILDNVNVVGTVDNPAEYYYKYPAVVMPIRYGSGMKVKTAEAMMFGCHIFASDEALEGYEVDGVKGIFCCNSKDEYILGINQFFDNRTENIYSEMVRELYRDKYSTDSVIEKMRKIMDEILCV